MSTVYMVVKSVPANKTEAKKLAKNLRKQDGCIGSVFIPLRSGAIVRALFPIPQGPLPDGCYLGTEDGELISHVKGSVRY